MDSATHYGCTALWMAAFHGPPGGLGCVDLLLRAGANVNAANQEHVTPLAIAAFSAPLKTANDLLHTKAVSFQPRGLVSGLGCLCRQACAVRLV